MLALVEWLAPAATILAAMMTAANLGARVTGWGFVVFTAGSVCWAIDGYASGQTSLLAANVFLTLVNIVGAWRWLGRQRVYEDGGKSAQQASRQSSTPTLFAATGVMGMPTRSSDGEDIGKAVEALVECRTGTVSYVVIASGSVAGLDEALRAVPRELVDFHSDSLSIHLGKESFLRLPPLGNGEWPASASQVPE